MQASSPAFKGFSLESLESLIQVGTNERWEAVQTQLHPQLVALAEQLRLVGLQEYPNAWPLYEFSFRSQRTNQHASQQSPIDNYYMGLDRPPRGCGIYIIINGVERSIIVALQLSSRQRKVSLRQLWEQQRLTWLPLIESLDDVRFADQRKAANTNSADQEQGEQTWMDRYLSARGTAYLLAGYRYSWDDPRIGSEAFVEQLISAFMALFPLNEAIMDVAEAHDANASRALHESSSTYQHTITPPISAIIDYINTSGFAFSESLIKAYHVALQTKPLVILPGISGTGKTRLTRLYADAIASAGQPDNYLLVAVQPDWHNARDLLGYYNALNNTFQPTAFLRFMMLANEHPSQLFFVCLDEMNLARPEYYLAPILSALETSDQLIDLGIPMDSAQTSSGETVPNPFRLPANIRITGTVNIDESTHTLSDKLLDRANVIELTDVDLAAFRANYRGYLDESAWQVLNRVHFILSQAGQAFGYRSVTEILRYIEQARTILPPAEALDLQIKQKILPKLRGDDNARLRRALTELLELLLDQQQQHWGRAANVSVEQLENAPFPESAEKVRRMLERLDLDGYTDFYA